MLTSGVFLIVFVTPTSSLASGWCSCFTFGGKYSNWRNYHQEFNFPLLFIVYHLYPHLGLSSAAKCGSCTLFLEGEWSIFTSRIRVNLCLLFGISMFLFVYSLYVISIFLWTFSFGCLCLVSLLWTATSKRLCFELLLSAVLAVVFLLETF